jgi:hypothetical protein
MIQTAKPWAPRRGRSRDCRQEEGKRPPIEGAHNDRRHGGRDRGRQPRDGRQQGELTVPEGPEATARNKHQAWSTRRRWPMMARRSRGHRGGRDGGVTWAGQSGRRASEQARPQRHELGEAAPAHHAPMTLRQVAGAHTRHRGRGDEEPCSLSAPAAAEEGRRQGGPCAPTRKMPRRKTATPRQWRLHTNPAEYGVRTLRTSRRAGGASPRGRTREPHRRRPRNRPPRHTLEQRKGGGGFKPWVVGSEDGGAPTDQRRAVQPRPRSGPLAQTQPGTAPARGGDEEGQGEGERGGGGGRRQRQEHCRRRPDRGRPRQRPQGAGEG